MSHSITSEQVLQIGRLSRIELSPAQVDEFYADVSKGKFKANPQLKHAYEQDIISASSSGRIIG